MRKFQKVSACIMAVALAATGCSGGSTGTKAPAEPAKTEAAGEAKAQAASGEAAGEEDPVLVVYTARSEALNNAVIPEFEKDTGIKVEVVVAGTGELLKRAQSEKDNPLGDIFWVADQTMRSAFQSLLAMLYGMGKDGDPLSDQAWDYVDQFIANLDGKMCNSSSQVYKGVAEGEYVVGLTWEDPAANYVKEGAAVEVVFPEEGAIFPGESVQILKDCKHPENAKKFVDYMLSEKIQNAVGSNLTVRPLRKDAKLADYMTPQSEIKLFDNYDEGWVAEHKTEITNLFSEHMETSMD